MNAWNLFVFFSATSFFLKFPHILGPLTVFANKMTAK